MFIANFAKIIPNLPIGAVVETNAVFRSGSITPVMAGEISKKIHPLISRVCTQQELVADGIAERDVRRFFLHLQMTRLLPVEWMMQRIYLSKCVKIHASILMIMIFL